MRILTKESTVLAKHNMENTCDTKSQLTEKSVATHIKNGYM